MKRSPWRKLAAGCIIAAGLAYVLALYIVGLSDKNAAQRDFISYWATGQLLVHGGNPYDVDAVRQLEVSVGRDPARPVLMMRNPPITLPLVAPLGFVRAKTGLIAWLLVLIGALGGSIWLLWRLNGKPDNSFHLLAIVFAPALACLMAGQFGIFLLLGVVLFLYFEGSHSFIAGAGLLLCAFKPHLFVPVAIPLLLCVTLRRRGWVIGGFVVALAAASATAYGLDAHMISQYLQMARSGEALAERIPALSVALRFAISPHTIWIQFVPEALACVWSAWYFWTRREQWRWNDHGLLVLLVAAVCTPYGFFTDESMLLPAVLAGAYRASERGGSLIPLAVIAGGALVELLAGAEINTPYYLWTAPAWLAWYVYATTNRTGSAAPSR
jgi:hypothetical protein